MANQRFEKPMMVSPALSQLLERARIRFGVEIEILDAALRNVYPEGESELTRILEDSPAIRRGLLDALAGGRTQRLEGPGAQYRVYPLRSSARRRQASGLMAIRQASGDSAQVLDAEPWSDLARSIVETDLAAADSLGDEQHRSRRMTGVLRFVDHITETPDEASLSLALLHAAAVWYDVDARLYRRTLAGDFHLTAWLPGVQPDPSTRALSAATVGDGELHRVTATAPGEAVFAGDGHELVIVPLTASGRTEWALVVFGGIPSDADLVLRLVARVAGTQFAKFAARRAQDARKEFEALLTDTSKAPELLAVRVVHALAHAIRAASGSLTLTRRGHTRRVAAVGRAAETSFSGDAEPVVNVDRVTQVLGLGDDDRAVLDVRAARGHEFTADTAIVVDACADVLRVWLAGALVSFDASLEVAAPSVSTFVTRIQEELERAKRFDLRLALILIDVDAPSDAAQPLEDALRRELRGSDVTGAMSGTRVAALLTHTDALGLDNVVRRVKQRLADAAERLNVSELTLGQAAFSPDMRNAEALLELALRQAEPVIVH
jgi:hypothetical protein